MIADVIVIGGGPGGMAAALAAHRANARVMLIEREARLGGILKQCIHDGFGVLRFGEKLSGPEYAARFIDSIAKTDIDVRLLTFVTHIEQIGDCFRVTVVSRRGVELLVGKALVLATGCRERTARQVGIHGTRPAGVMTAGTAQHFVNLMGEMPGKRCVILGSGDIGLIMARRLTLEGAEVVGVYEAKSTPSGLQRNIRQCLDDFDIPLHLSATVTRVFGRERVEGVEISGVDDAMHPIAGTARRVDCDCLILSVGLIPENELAEALDVPIDPRTKGPISDSNGMTVLPGVFTCGNAQHVNDLVDYVSESGETAGTAAAHWSDGRRKWAVLSLGDEVLYAVPQRILPDIPTTLYFRVRRELKNAEVTLTLDGQPLLHKQYAALRPPEMERLSLPALHTWKPGSTLMLEVKEA